MDRSLVKSPLVLLAFGLWILACPESLAEDDDPNALHQQVSQLIGQGKYQEAIPIAERAVELAKRTLGPDHPKTADVLNDLGFVFQKIGNYAKAEPLYQEALRIRQKVLRPEDPDTALSLNNLAALYQDLGEYAKAEPLYQEALRIRQNVLGLGTPRYGEQPQWPGCAVLGNGGVRQSRTALPGSAPDLPEGPWARTSRHSA